MVQSKRKVLGSNNQPQTSPKKRRSHEKKSEADDRLDDSSLFSSMLSDAGLVLMNKSHHHKLMKDPGIFQRGLMLDLKKHPETPQVVDEFMEGFSQHIEDIHNLHQALLTTQEYEDGESGGKLHDGLVRLLMGIDLLQPPVMERLLEKLAELDMDVVMVDGFGKVNLPHLILNQFRWLDRVVKSQELVDKMFEVLSVTNVSVQSEIISCLPEVVEDIQHGEITARLKELLSENNELAVPILDAMSNLNIKPDLLCQVRTSVVEALRSAALTDLPVMLRFLLQSVTQADALEVVQEVRENLDLESSSVVSSKTATSSKACGLDKQVEKSCASLIVDAIRSAVRFQRPVADAWLKAIETSSSSYKAIDIVVLLVLHSSGQHRAVETLGRQKIRSAKLSVQLFTNTISVHKQVLREYFSSLLSLAEVFLRSPEPVVSHFAESIYTQAFLHFDTYCKQEIVGTLVTHIGSGYEAEVDASLNILLHLVEKHTSSMEPFSVFIKGVLDYVDNLHMGQTRKLYSMLSTLAFRGSRDESSIQDEMYIIIRKQLSNTDIKYQRMGVLGAIMVVRSLAHKSEAVVFSQDSEQGMSDERLRQAISLLQLIRTSVGGQPEAMGLFLDELASVINNGAVHVRLEAWISENVISDFQDDFIVDFEPNLNHGNEPIPWKMQFNLDDDGEGAILVPILRLLAQGNTTSPTPSSHNRSVSAVCLPSHFRLLQVCEARQHEGNLEGIDALLGCLNMMPDLTMVDKLNSFSKSESQLFIHSLFLLINWFRELLNGFATQDTPEMKAKVLSRLKSITDVQKTLQKALSASPQTLPPPANFDQDDPLTSAPGAAALKKLPKPPSKGKKRKKANKEKGGKSGKDADETQDESNESTVLDTQGDPYAFTEASEEKDKICSVDLSNYRPFFRELDLPVFNVLQFGLITQAALDSNLNTKDTTTLQIQPPQLLFLLTDLSAKLDHALLAKRPSYLKLARGARQRSGFSHLDLMGTEQVVRQVVALLPALCNHLEATSAFFQALEVANDGVVDGPGHNTDESHLMSTCLHLLLQIYLSLFSWNGFSDDGHRDLLRDALSHLSHRINPSTSSQTPLHDLLHQAFQYVEKFSATLPHLPAGVTLCRLLVSVSDRSDDDSLAIKIGELSESLLKREWLDGEGERAKGAKHNEQIQSLIKIYFEYQSDILACLEWICSVAVPELIETDKQGCSASMAILSRNSFGVCYRAILQELVESVKTLSPGKASDGAQMKNKRLLQWNRAVRVFHILVNLVKAFDGRANLGTALKWGRLFVDVFLRQGMPLLDHSFTRHKDDVQGLLKNLQLSTRTLHHMCGHSKIMKDVSLTNQVPPLKRALEQFVYRVKAMLTLNKCQEAFWLGNLKNRDLRGEEILSQSTQRTAATSDDEDDAELPADASDEETDGTSVTSGRDEVSGARDSSSDEEDGDSYSETY